jgi:hypothetical protein
MRIKMALNFVRNQQYCHEQKSPLLSDLVGIAKRIWFSEEAKMKAVDRSYIWVILGIFLSLFVTYPALALTPTRDKACLEGRV